MILRSVGIAGAIVVGLAVLVGADAAPRAPARSSGRGRPVRGPARRATRRHRTGRGRGSPGGSCATRSRSWSRRWRSCSSSARRSSTSGSTPRTPSILPPSVPSRAAFDRLRDELRRGRVRADRAGDPDRRAGHRRPANLAALYDYSRRLAADPRVAPRRQPGRRRSAPDARPVPRCCTATRTARATGSSRRRWRRRPAAT